jgi:hypothetical protein
MEYMKPGYRPMYPMSPSPYRPDMYRRTSPMMEYCKIKEAYYHSKKSYKILKELMKCYHHKHHHYRMDSSSCSYMSATHPLQDEDA